MGKSILVLGGARSGKSEFAEGLAREAEKAGASVVYLAACRDLPGDVEMAARIARHRKRRPSSWVTVEEPLSPEPVIGSLPGKSVLLMDCLSLWISNLLFEGPETGDEETAERVLDRVRGLIVSAASSRGDVILVSSETGCGVVPPTPLGRLYRDILGWANQEAAKAAGEVWFIVAGLPQKLK